jgi:hypothetical protein
VYPTPSFLPVADEFCRWYKGTAPKTRILIGVGIMAYAGAGLFLSDKAEEKFGLVPTEQDKEDLQKALPTITTVEREKR